MNKQLANSSRQIGKQKLSTVPYVPNVVQDKTNRQLANSSRQTNENSPCPSVKSSVVLCVKNLSDLAPLREKNLSTVSYVPIVVQRKTCS